MLSPSGWLATKDTTLGSCVTIIKVFPLSAKFIKSSTIDFPVSLSKFPVGSSARISLGSLINARATATL